MKEILDRHAERLTPEERRATWSRISEARAAHRRFTMRRAVPALAMVATVVVAVSVIAVLQRERSLPWNSTAERFLRSSAPVVEPAPAARPARPEALRPGTVAESGPAAQAPAHGREESVAPRKAPRATAPPRATAIGPPAVAPEVPAARIVPLPIAGATPAVPASGDAGVVEGRVTDEKNQPVPFASVSIPSARRGALSDEHGNYRISGVAPGPTELQVRYLGYRPTARRTLVSPGATSTVDITMTEPLAIQQLESIEVTAQKRILETKQGTTVRSVIPGRLKEIPVDNLREATRIKAGIVAQGGELHFRGGRGDGVQFQHSGIAAAPAQPPVVPTTGGTKLPNDEAFDSMFFRDYGVNPFVATDEDPLSTFAVDVDAASYTLTRRYLGLGQLPPKDAVRVEEFVNFFRQGYPRFEDDDFRILVDGAPSAFGAGYQLVRIGIKGREVSERDRKPARLTFVIDVSGSMDRENRLELVKRALRLLVDELHAEDRVGIVVYNTKGRVLLEPVALGGPRPWRAPWEHADERGAGARKAPARGRERVLKAIERLAPGGSTNAEEGLRLGYEMARRAYRPGVINRIVLCSDGVANVGATGPEAILRLVRGEADRGIHLTTVGVGMGNYNDVLLEQLADQGDGNHYYVDDEKEARRVLVENLTGTLQTIAKDAKVQVEFDSTRVARYRLLGFENRDVADRDFRNDKVDAGEIGAGHEVTALYEVKLTPGAAPGRLATVRFRYARPEYEGAGAPRVRELERTFDVADLARRFEDASPRFRLDAAVAEFAELLRGSYWARDGRFADVLAVAREAAGALGDGPSAEFVTLVEKAAALGLGPKSEGRGGTK